MTPKSIHEYAAVLRVRYYRAGKKEKGGILSEFCRNTGYHRKAAIRLLRQGPQLVKERRGRPREYGSEVGRALRVAWEATGHVGPKRLAPFLPTLIPLLERQRELNVTAETHAQLLRVSASTVERLLKPFHVRGLRQPYNSTPPPPGLKARIPMRTFADWSGCGVGYLEVDLVAHCGQSAEGFFLHTLVAVDVATGWTHCLPIWGKAYREVRGALDRLRRGLPFVVLGIDSDNGGEFINHDVYTYCRDNSIQFTRSRPYKKNDQAYVEQKNWTAVRKLIGYDRYNSRPALHQLELVYRLLGEHMNYFQPLCKLVHKERHGARVHKQYDRAQTPLQRLLASGTLRPSEEQALSEHFQSLNPIKLRTEIDEALTGLWKLANQGTRLRRRARHGQVQDGDGLEEGDDQSESAPSPQAAPVR